MHHYRAADRGLCIVRERNLMVDVIQLGVAGSVCFHISHVALMPCDCLGPGMRLVRGIEMRACGTGIGCTAIAKFVDMKPVLTRRQARDLCVDLHAPGDRRERDGAADFIACGGMQYRNAF